MASFGARLRKLRRERDWTQEYVSNHLSVVRSTYAYYESGKTFPDYKTIIQLANLFDVTTDYLLVGEETMSELSSFESSALMRDGASSTYLPIQTQGKLSKWQLKATEQRLVIAFRMLSTSQQRSLLEMVEKLALDECGKKEIYHDQEQDPDPDVNNQENE